VTSSGTYLVFRKLHTRVAAYRQYLRPRRRAARRRRCSAPTSPERAADRARALVAITSAVDVLDYTEGTVACHARLIAHARRAGKPRGAHDLIIAAHALPTDRIILTFGANARFGDLPGVSATSL
jgi:predicted nucleic acid-binding protein